MKGSELFLRDADVFGLRLTGFVWIVENPHAHLRGDLCGFCFGK